MKISAKNIAITLGVAAGAAVAAVLTTKKLNHEEGTKPELKQDKVTLEKAEVVEEQDDILYV